MILHTDISDRARELSDRRHALATMTVIPDMWKYADEWNRLGADFAALGYSANSEKCFQKSMHYAAQAGPRPQPPQPYKVAFCVTCDTWTQHALNVTGDYYSCACGDGLEYHRAGAGQAAEAVAALLGGENG